MTSLRRRVGGAAAAVAILAMVVAGSTAAMSADATPSDVPASLHGAVETKAMTFGTGVPPSVPSAGGLLVDPGPAYAYVTVDRDEFSGGNVSQTMTARGANLDPGAIAAAALWVAPVCSGPDSPNAPCVLSGGAGTNVDTGLEYARGWPGYAEALFPDQPGAKSQQRVYKCIVNKDANGAAPTGGQAQDVCKAGGTSVPVTAWAEAIGAEIRATGFSRALGFDIPGVASVGASESFGEVKPDKGGVLRSSGYSTIKSISLLGGQITIDAVRSAGEIVASPSGTKTKKASCTFAGLTVAGQPVSQTSGGELPATQLDPLLKAVYDATQIRVQIIPPKPVRITTVEGGKHVAECSGMQINLDDERQQAVPVCASPSQCVPPLGAREEILFGKLSVLESVNGFASSLVGDSAAVLGATAEQATGAGQGAASAGELASAPAAGGGSAADASSLPASSGGGGAVYGAGTTVSRPLTAARAGPDYRIVRPNLARIGAYAAGASGALGLCIWLLIVVVGAIARGTTLRFGRS
jgi:hypothetical protein